MKFSIKFTTDAVRHLKGFRKFEQKIIAEAIKQRLTIDPLTPAKNRKPLRENPLSRWELRVDRFRVFYEADADDHIVEIKAVGRKEHNRLFIEEKEFKL
jgi:mRNA-degrading endonuclease RelE of RelBE toxin-antitoxin system